MPFPIEEKYIAKMEATLNVTFPPDFRKKMMFDNGGEIVNDQFEFELFPFFDSSDKKRIKRTCNHIGLETKNAQGWTEFPENAIAIGADGFGNHLILLHGGDGVLGDTLYFWDHETGKYDQITDSIMELKE